MAARQNNQPPDQLTLADFAPAAQLPNAEEFDLRDLARLDGVPDALFTLITASPRRPDLLAENDCIRKLLGDGWSEQDIAAATGYTHSAIARRLRLSNLIPELAAFKQSGGLTNAGAEACAKFPIAVQRQLAAEAVANDGKLTSSHIAQARHVRAAQAAAQLPESLFTTPGVEAGPVHEDWRTTASDRLTGLLDLVPEGQTKTRVAIQIALRSLSVKEKKQPYFAPRKFTNLEV